MRRNPFDVLVRLRKIDEKMARAELATKRRAHDQARRKLEELKAKHTEELEVGELLGPVNLRSLQLRGMGSYELLTAAAEVYQNSERAMHAKAEAWRRAASDVDAAERLDERRRQELAREAAKSAEKSLDDLMGMLHSRPRDGLI
jgi:membrane protein involved in colicin uptake